MKKKIILSILGLCLLGVFYGFGFFHRYNFVTGLIDKWTGTYTVVHYGEPGPNDSNLYQLAKEQGFEYKRIAGCNVTKSLIIGATHYNWVMKDYLSEKHGRKFMENFK